MVEREIVVRKGVEKWGNETKELYKVNPNCLKKLTNPQLLRLNQRLLTRLTKVEADNLKFRQAIYGRLDKMIIGGELTIVFKDIGAEKDEA